MVIFLYNLYIFVWIMNRVSALDPKNSVIKRWWLYLLTHNLLVYSVIKSVLLPQYFLRKSLEFFVLILL